MAPTTLKKFIVSLFIAFGPAVAWIIYLSTTPASSNHANSLETYGIYPISLGFSAILSALIFDGDLENMAFNFSRIKYATKAFMFANILICFPFILNLISEKIIISGEPQFNKELITIGLPIFLVFAMAQELMWRGWMLSVLINDLSFFKSALIIGILSAIWQYPLIINTRILYSDLPLWFSLPMFTLTTIGISFISCYLRLIARSIWPVIFFNAIGSYASLALIKPLEETVGDSSIYFKHNIGVYYMLTAVITGAISSRLFATSNAAKRMNAQKAREQAKVETSLELA